MHMGRAVTVLISTLLAIAVLDDAFARSKGGFSGGSSRGFSAPSASRTSSGSPRGFSPSPSKSAPSYKATAPQTRPTIRGTPAASSPKAAAEPVRRSTYDSQAQRALRDAESARKFREEQSRQQPPQTPSAAVRPRSSTDRPPIFESKRQQARERPVVINRTYETRREDGSIDPFFWLWLMERNNNHYRDEWIYHNRDRLSADEMARLREKDARLDDRLREIENKGVTKDPAFKIPESEVRPQQESGASKGGSSLWLWIGSLLLIAAAVYFIFFHRIPRRRFA